MTPANNLICAARDALYTGDYLSLVALLTATDNPVVTEYIVNSAKGLKCEYIDCESAVSFARGVLKTKDLPEQRKSRILDLLAIMERTD